MTWFLAAWLAWQAAVTPEAKAQIQAGLRAKKEGRLEDAALALRAAAQSNPGLWAVHASLGEVYYLQRDFARAIPALRRALELKADQPGVEGMLGVALLARGEVAEAIPHLERSPALDALGVALLETGRTREAQEKLEAAREKKPGDADILFHLAQAYHRRAKEALEEILARHPGSARARQVRAETLAAAGRADSAEREYREALRLQPDLQGLHLALGELYFTSGDFERAAAEFRAEPGAQARLGAALLKLGRAKDALEALEQAARKKPGAPETLYDLGKAREMTGDLAGAEQAWLRVVELDAGIAAQAHYSLSLLYQRQGKSALAERHRRAFR